jgi:2',3'-cyclic-nucleotide 2'-phosphodiesterase (5'-nucleotidase family)
MNQIFPRTGTNWLVAAAAIGLLFGCDRPANSGPAPSKELSIIYTNSNNGELKDCGCPHHPLGGMARRAKWVQDLKQGVTSGVASPPRQVLQVDAGDGFFAYQSPGLPASPSDQAKAKVIARALAKMGEDAINAGSQDFGAGFDFLKNDLAGQNHLPLISSNLFDKQKQDYPFPRQLVIERAGLRIGVFGLIQELSPERAGNLEVKDPQQAAGEMVGQLRGKCDVVIGLVNLDFERAAALARQVPEIDLIVVSRGSRTTPQPFLAEGSLVVQAGYRGKQLGRMDIKMKPGGYDSQALKQREQLRREREEFEAQRKILEGQATQADPQFKAKYDEVVRKIADADKRLKEIHGGFENHNSMVDVELSLPEDPQIAQWTAEVLGPSQTPAPPATPATPPAKP